MFFFFFDQFKAKYHRDFHIEHEIYIVILRLLQLRRIDPKHIYSIKSCGRELKSYPGILELDLSSLSKDEAKRICDEVGYRRAKRGAKCDVEINNKRVGIRCLNFTDAALVNHTTRPKYEKVCKKIGLSIDEFDTIIDNYISRRKAGAFNEDIHYSTPANPFIPHRGYLKRILTFMAFHSFNFRKDFDEDGFITDTIDEILDFADPADNNTWRQYSPATYFDSIWSSLCFSLRDNKGMPSDDELYLPSNESIRRWNYPYQDGNGRIRNKAALHIRIKNYDSLKYGKPFEEKYQKEITEIRQNTGERDEYLLKLFLIECRQKSLPVPLGDGYSIVKSVGGTMDTEYQDLAYSLQWSSLQPEELISVCASVNISKAGMFDKADVYINKIGISVKSRRGAAPSIINQTSRDRILRVMNSLNLPIAPLDHIVDRYWQFRINGGTEDVNNTDHPDNPFCISENGDSNIEVLRPLLNYFVFKGTGTRDSKKPAELVLSMELPDDISTWTYYDESNFVNLNWPNMVFSLRHHGMPRTLNEDMMPWIRFIDGKSKGLLNVRIK